jgi:hypothetical protein
MLAHHATSESKKSIADVDASARMGSHGFGETGGYVHGQLPG